MKKGPGHSSEGHLGSPDTDLTLKDRRAPTHNASNDHWSIPTSLPAHSMASEVMLTVTFKL